MALCNFAAIFQYSSMLLQQNAKGVSAKMIYHGSFFVFKTFSIILDQVGNEHVYPAVHVYLAFVWSMTRNNDIMEHINELIPWQKIATFLNGMACSDIDFSVIECDEFPIVGDRRHMPEDFFIHGYDWSQNYFPENFFKDAMTEDNGHLIEVPSMRASRIHWCLWMGHQIPNVCLLFLFLQDNC